MEVPGPDSLAWYLLAIGSSTHVGDIPREIPKGLALLGVLDDPAEAGE